MEKTARGAGKEEKTRERRSGAQRQRYPAFARRFAALLSMIISKGNKKFRKNLDTARSNPDHKRATRPGRELIVGSALPAECAHGVCSDGPDLSSGVQFFHFRGPIF